MPAVSAKQKRFMDAAAHSPSFAGKAGIPQGVAQDFSTASKGQHFGQETRPDRQAVNKQKTDHGDMSLFKNGGSVKAEKMQEERHARTLRQLAKEEQAEADKMNRGGSVKKPNPFVGGETPAKEKAEKRFSTSAYRRGEKSEGEMACGGKVKKMAKGGYVRAADGIAQRGKTRGKTC